MYVNVKFTSMSSIDPPTFPSLTERQHQSRERGVDKRHIDLVQYEMNSSLPTSDDIHEQNTVINFLSNELPPKEI
jgi:hypothetical protein